jgi:hypothetical protein
MDLQAVLDVLAEHSELANLTPAEVSAWGQAPVTTYQLVSVPWIYSRLMEGGEEDRIRAVGQGTWPPGSTAPADPSIKAQAEYACRKFCVVLDNPGSFPLFDTRLPMALAMLGDAAHLATAPGLLVARGVISADTRAAIHGQAAVTQTREQSLGCGRLKPGYIERARAYLAGQEA